MAETISPPESYSGSPTPEEEGSEKRYSPVDLEPGYYPGYAPSYAPSEAPPYAPYGPEAADFEARAIEAIRGVVERANQRANERYGGSRIGRVRQFFRREGSRNQEETLEQIGEWQKNAKWKKWALFGAKAAGGVGVAAAMVATGGAGAILTPLLWSAGVREAWDGTLEAVEELGWGRKRSQAELAAQAVLSQKINSLKEGVTSPEINEERFATLLGEMLDAENEVIASEVTNVKGEKKGKLIRSIASTVLSVGTGLLAGVPLGTHDYDKGATKVGNVFLDKAHRVMWNLKGGGQFLYNSPAELTRVATEAVNHGYGLTLHGVSGVDLYRQIGHVLGHGLPIAEKAGLVAAAGYQVLRNILDFLPKKSKTPGPDEADPYAPYAPDMPSYGPDSSSYGPSDGSSYSPSYGPGSPDGSAGGETESAVSLEAEVDDEKSAAKEYLGGLSPEKMGELVRLSEGLPMMSKECKFAVCIPASYAESAVIYHTLEQYLGQNKLDGKPLNPEEFEVNIYVNGPEDKQAEVTKTVEEINRFKKDHPEIKVNCISKTFKERAMIGALRKDINDLTLMRSLDRIDVNNPLCLVSNDADVEKIDPQYLAKAERILRNNPEIKMFGGKEDYTEKEYAQYPYLLAARRLWQFADIVMRHRKYSDFLPKTVGLNSFIRAGSYAKAGGYRENSHVAEDLELARDIASKEGSKAISHKNIPVLTSPRRDIAMIEKGIPIVHAYHDFGDRESFREEPPQPVVLESLTPENPQFVKRLENEASAVFNDLHKRFFWSAFDRNSEVRQRRAEGGRKADVKDLQEKLRKDPRYGGEATRKAGVAFRKTMGFWGAEYSLLEDQYSNFKVKISDTSKLQEGLARHQA